MRTTPACRASNEPPRGNTHDSFVRAAFQRKCRYRNQAITEMLLGARREAAVSEKLPVESGQSEAMTETHMRPGAVHPEHERLRCHAIDEHDRMKQTTRKYTTLYMVDYDVLNRISCTTKRSYSIFLKELTMHYNRQHNLLQAEVNKSGSNQADTTQTDEKERHRSVQLKSAKIDNEVYVEDSVSRWLYTLLFINSKRNECSLHKNGNGNIITKELGLLDLLEQWSGSLEYVICVPPNAALEAWCTLMQPRCLISTDKDEHQKCGQRDTDIEIIQRLLPSVVRSHIFERSLSTTDISNGCDPSSLQGKVHQFISLTNSFRLVNSVTDNRKHPQCNIQYLDTKKLLFDAIVGKRVKYSSIDSKPCNMSSSSVDGNRIGRTQKSVMRSHSPEDRSCISLNTSPPMTQQTRLKSHEVSDLCSSSAGSGSIQLVKCVPNYMSLQYSSDITQTKMNAHRIGMPSSAKNMPGSKDLQIAECAVWRSGGVPTNPSRELLPRVLLLFLQEENEHGQTSRTLVHETNEHPDPLAATIRRGRARTDHCIPEVSQVMALDFMFPVAKEDKQKQFPPICFAVDNQIHSQSEFKNILNCERTTTDNDISATALSHLCTGENAQSKPETDMVEKLRPLETFLWQAVERIANCSCNPMIDDAANHVARYERQSLHSFTTVSKISSDTDEMSDNGASDQDCSVPPRLAGVAGVSLSLAQIIFSGPKMLHLEASFLMVELLYFLSPVATNLILGEIATEKLLRRHTGAIIPGYEGLLVTQVNSLVTYLAGKFLSSALPDHGWRSAKKKCTDDQRLSISEAVILWAKLHTVAPSKAKVSDKRQEAKDKNILIDVGEVESHSSESNMTEEAVQILTKRLYAAVLIAIHSILLTHFGPFLLHHWRKVLLPDDITFQYRCRSLMLHFYGKHRENQTQHNDISSITTAHVVSNSRFSMRERNYTEVILNVNGNTLNTQSHEQDSTIKQEKNSMFQALLQKLFPRNRQSGVTFADKKKANNNSESCFRTTESDNAGLFLRAFSSYCFGFRNDDDAAVRDAFCERSVQPRNDNSQRFRFSESECSQREISREFLTVDRLKILANRIVPLLWYLGGGVYPDQDLTGNRVQRDHRKEINDDNELSNLLSTFVAGSHGDLPLLHSLSVFSLARLCLYTFNRINHVLDDFQRQDQWAIELKEKKRRDNPNFPSKNCLGRKSEASGHHASMNSSVLSVEAENCWSDRKSGDSSNNKEIGSKNQGNNLVFVATQGSKTEAVLGREHRDQDPSNSSFGSVYDPLAAPSYRTADEYLPVLMWLICVSGPPRNFLATLRYIESFPIPELHGTALDYAVTTFQAAALQLRHEYETHVLQITANNDDDDD